MIDITNKPGDPAHALQERYSELMQIADANEVKNEAFLTVQGTHFSKANWAKFKRTMDSLTGLDDIRFFLTNFILKASGRGIIR